jgi:hypothetical protein
MKEQTTVPDAESAVEPPASRWEDYIDVFASPVELFRRRADDRLAPPLVTLLLLAVVFYFIMLPANSMVMRASLGDNPDAAAMMDRFGTLLQILGSIVVPLTYLFMLAVSAATLLVIGRIAEIRTDFSRLMLIVTYAGFVYLLAQMAGGVAIMLQGAAGLDVIRHLSFGPLRFIGSADMNPVATALLRRFELFTIWQTVLWGIGIAVIYNVGRARAFTVAFAAWALLALPAIVMGALGIGQTPAA